ncbi:MAG TPA: glycosyltransferase [Bryobacteraceae bacterium]|nr:glycosyltransferase [Bryobacteraceae bacterium]
MKDTANHDDDGRVIAHQDGTNRDARRDTAGAGTAPAVTVLMSVRDAPVEMLDGAVASVLGQTFTDFEFLILDDGSRAGACRDALERHAQSDARIRLRHEPARGLTKTLNLGLAGAAGRYIAREDADDWSEPDRLARQVEFLDHHPEIAVCGTNAWMHQENGAPLWATRLPEQGAEIARALERGNPFVHGATMFRAHAARAVGGYCERFACSQDYDFFWRLADAGGAVNLAAPLYHYRFRRGAVSEQRAAEQARVHRATRALAGARRVGADADIGGALEEADRHMRVPRERLGALLKQADHRLLAGDYAGAARAYRSLLGRHPANALAWGKLIRWLVFLTAPRARRLCFR